MKIVVLNPRFKYILDLPKFDSLLCVIQAVHTFISFFHACCASTFDLRHPFCASTFDLRHPCCAPTFDLRHPCCASNFRPPQRHLINFKRLRTY
jgi:hypothetical protein